MDVGEALKNALVGHIELHLSNAIAQTPMYTVTKCDVLLHVFACHIKDVWVGENSGVSIRSAVPHDDFFIFSDLLSGDFSVLSRCPAHVHDRRRHTQGFVRHALNERGVIDDHLSLVLEFGEESYGA